jgi:hypothetical protein
MPLYEGTEFIQFPTGFIFVEPSKYSRLDPFGCLLAIISAEERNVAARPYYSHLAA